MAYKPEAKIDLCEMQDEKLQLNFCPFFLSLVALKIQELLTKFMTALSCNITYCRFLL